MARKPGVVAELGRPETPGETAARKAESSRVHGAARTTRNLVWALVGSLLVLAVIILGVPRTNSPIDRSVDYAAVGAEVQSGYDDRTIAVPELPDGWTANAAELRTDSKTDVTAWYAGFVTPGDAYLGMYQGFAGTDEWVEGLIGTPKATTETEVEGVRWTIYDNRASANDVGNVAYAMVAESGDTVYVLLGTAEPAEFAAYATAIAPAVAASADETAE